MIGQCVNGGELAMIASVTVTGSCVEGGMPMLLGDHVLGRVLLRWQWAVLDRVLQRWWSAVQAVHDSP